MPVPFTASAELEPAPPPLLLSECKNAPFLMTSLSRAILELALRSMLPSTECAVASLKTSTGLCWPMRWQRSMAWRSLCGFQSES